MDGHRTAERRSLAYHRVIADRLLQDGQLVDAALARVRGWHDVHPRYRDAWLEILQRPHDDIARLVVEDSERMTMLRQVSPFAGAIDARTRWQIWRSVA